jgi:hypothetical protein
MPPEAPDAPAKPGKFLGGVFRLDFAQTAGGSGGVGVRRLLQAVSWDILIEATREVVCLASSAYGSGSSLGATASGWSSRARRNRED